MRSIGLYTFTLSYCASAIALALFGARVGIVVFIVVFLAGAPCARLYARKLHIPIHTARASVRTVCFTAICGFALAVARMALIPDGAPAGFAGLFDEKTSLVGTVVALPDERETSTRITVEVSAHAAISAREETMRLIASVPRYPPVRAGDIVLVSGKLERPEPFSTDGGRTFDYPGFLRKDGVYGLIQPAQAETVGRSPNAWLRFLRALGTAKRFMTRALADALPEPESSLAAGLLLGGKQGLGDELIDAFTRAGLLQIVVLSGYNVMVIADVLMRALSALPKRYAFAVASASMACFVLIAGAGSSALRAGLMAFFAMSARTFGKQYDVLRAVCASLLVLGLWNPLMLAYDPGFQFSFIATLGLIFLSPAIVPRLAFLRSTLVIDMAAATLAAECALLPFLLWQTGNLSLVSVAANIAVTPAIPYAMGLSVLGAALALPLAHLSPALAALAGLPAYLPLAYLIQIAARSASLPFAEAVISAFPFWIVAAAYAALAFLLLRSRARPLRPGSGARPRPS